MRLGLLLIILIFACVALSPMAEAVVPAPDGGYAGANTAEGQNALLSLTGGGYNTAVGWFSLESLTTGSFNTAVGAGTLVLNTGDENTATGAGALFNNTTGDGNTASGSFALFSTSEGSHNTGNGFLALYSNTIGGHNTASGYRALYGNISGNGNVAIGQEALRINTNGVANTAVGSNALFNNTTGYYNTALGQNAGIGVTTAQNVICIGAVGANVSHSCYIGEIFGQTSASGVPVLINSSNRLGTTTSSRRFKQEIKPMEQVSEVLFALKPVTFCYKKEIDPARTSQLGLIAEDVEKVSPNLVVRDKEGKPYSVRYDQVNAMLLNEFLKEHRKVQEQEATIAELKANDVAQLKEIKALAATLKEQASEIQKVSAQLELQKAAPQTVLNNQ